MQPPTLDTIAGGGSTVEILLAGALGLSVLGSIA